MTRLSPDMRQAIALLSRQLHSAPAGGDPVGLVYAAARELMDLRAVVRSAAVELEGCGDNSCIVQRPKGMATNGGCRCEKHHLRRAVQVLKARLRVQSEET